MMDDDSETIHSVHEDFEGGDFEFTWVDDAEYVAGKKHRLPPGLEWRTLFWGSYTKARERQPIWVNCTGINQSAHKQLG